MRERLALECLCMYRWMFIEQRLDLAVKAASTYHFGFGHWREVADGFDF